MSIYWQIATKSMCLIFKSSRHFETDSKQISNTSQRESLKKLLSWNVFTCVYSFWQNRIISLFRTLRRKRRIWLTCRWTGRWWTTWWWARATPWNFAAGTLSLSDSPDIAVYWYVYADGRKRNDLQCSHSKAWRPRSIRRSWLTNSSWPTWLSAREDMEKFES